MEKKLKPTLRENKRYLLLQTQASNESIQQGLLEFLGTLGYAKSSPQFLSNVPGTILAINREMIDPVRAALALNKEQIRVKKVSGTIKGLR